MDIKKLLTAILAAVLGFVIIKVTKDLYISLFIVLVANLIIFFAKKIYFNK